MEICVYAATLTCLCDSFVNSPSLFLPPLPPYLSYYTHTHTNSMAHMKLNQCILIACYLASSHYASANSIKHTCSEVQYTSVRNFQCVHIHFVCICTCTCTNTCIYNQHIQVVHIEVHCTSVHDKFSNTRERQSKDVQIKSPGSNFSKKGCCCLRWDLNLHPSAFY